MLSIQVHNASANSSDFTARPFLHLGVVDEINLGNNEPSNWCTIPNTYFHTNFKLSTGEPLILSGIDNSLTDVIALNENLREGLSMGYSPSNYNSICYYDNPTPGSSNESSWCYSGIEDDPIFTIPSGWYDEDIDVAIQNDNSDAIVKFTHNGDEPGNNDQEYSSPISLAETSIISAKAFSTSNNLPSSTSDAIYILNEQQSGMNVFSVITDSLNLWDWETGIYVLGDNASSDYPYFGSNFWQPGSKKSRLKYFNSDGYFIISGIIYNFYSSIDYCRTTYKKYLSYLQTPYEKYFSLYGVAIVIKYLFLYGITILKKLLPYYLKTVIKKYFYFSKSTKNK
jgi:hypothetical protein